MSQMNTKTPFALLLPLIFLAGCEEDRIATLCDTQPELCVGLHTDSWCANERNAVVRGRDLQARMPGDASLHQLMTGLDSYHKCLEPVLGIEYSKRKERKNDKVEAMTNAREELARLEQQTRESDYPHLQLWHWHHKGDHAARMRFLNQADRPAMQQPELQRALAQLLARRDPQAAEQALHRALGLYPAGAAIDTGIFADLISLYLADGRHADAWLWSRVMATQDPEQNIDWQRLQSYAAMSPEQQADLQRQADDILLRLREGRYLR